MSEQNTYLNSWPVTCTREQSDRHTQASLFRDTGDWKLQRRSALKEPVARRLWKQHCLSEDDDSLLISQGSHQYQFCHLSTSYLWTKTLFGHLPYLKWCAGFSARFSWQTFVTLKPRTAWKPQSSSQPHSFSVPSKTLQFFLKLFVTWGNPQ